MQLCTTCAYCSMEGACTTDVPPEGRSRQGWCISYAQRNADVGEYVKRAQYSRDAVKPIRGKRI